MSGKQSVREKIAGCPVHPTLLQHSDEFHKQLIQVTDGVHVAVGFALSNSILIEAPEGLIIVDTTETTYAAAEVLRAFRTISDRPIRAIIYTHSHEDHIGGAGAFLPESGRDNVEIWAHEKFIEMATSMEHVLLRPAVLPRVIRQFGLGLEKIHATVNSGIGPPMRGGRLNVCWPNKLAKGHRQEVNIAGLTVVLLHIPGETPCQMAVWIPSRKVLLPGDDFYKAFPNLYAIRGTSPRSVITWAESLDVMRQLGAQYMVPSHTKPLIGTDTVYHALTCYRDAIQFVHDQTVRLMNKGLHPVDIARSIQLPDSLSKEPYLQPLYGTPEWSSRAVFDAYVGWFSGAVEELFPLTPSQKAARMLQYFTEEKALAAAQLALQKQDFQWALELSSYLYSLQPDNQAALSIRTEAILALASQQVSANARNYFLTCLAEDHGIHPRRYQTAHTIKAMPLEAVLKKMQYCLNPSAAGKLSVKACMSLTDSNTSYSLTIRNAILEITEGKSPDCDLFFSLSSTTLKRIMAGDVDITDVHKDIDTQQTTLLNTFFQAFDFGEDSPSNVLQKSQL